MEERGKSFNLELKAAAARDTSGSESRLAIDTSSGQGSKNGQQHRRIKGACLHLDANML